MSRPGARSVGVVGRHDASREAERLFHLSDPDQVERRNARMRGRGSEAGGFTPGQVEIARGAHLAGAGFGALYFFGIMKSSGSKRRRRRRSSSSAHVDVRSVPPPPVRSAFDRTAAEEAQLDVLLRKVSEGGLDSLTPKERDFLMEMSKKSRRP